MSPPGKKVGGIDFGFRNDADHFWYTDGMDPSKDSAKESSYRGHVKNGVVVLDDKVALNDGQQVRVEPLDSGTNAQDAERAERVDRLKQLFAQWTDEDGKLSEEEADCLRAALDRNRGLHFRSATND